MNAQTKIILKKVLSDYSLGIIYNSKKFKAIMRDYHVPKLDVNLLAEIMSSPAFISFISSEQNFNNLYQKKKLLNELKSEYPFDLSSLEQGIDCFIFALDIQRTIDKKNDIDIVNEINEMGTSDRLTRCETEDKLLADVIKVFLNS